MASLSPSQLIQSLEKSERFYIEALKKPKAPSLFDDLDAIQKNHRAQLNGDMFIAPSTPKKA